MDKIELVFAADLQKLTRHEREFFAFLITGTQPDGPGLDQGSTLREIFPPLADGLLEALGEGQDTRGAWMLAFEMADPTAEEKTVLLSDMTKAALWGETLAAGVRAKGDMAGLAAVLDGLDRQLRLQIATILET